MKWERARGWGAAQVIHLKAERDVLRMVNHPGLVNMLGAFQDAVCVYFVMEYVSGGEFFRQLRLREKYGHSPASISVHNQTYSCLLSEQKRLWMEGRKSGVPSHAAIDLQISRRCC